MPDPGRARRVLLAPVTVTPTKPLTPSHLKGLLWTDVMFRATARVADVTYRCSHTTYHPTEQTAGFWEYLDRTVGDVDYSGWTEEQVGDRYVAFRAAGAGGPEACRPYLDAVEEQGWVHPASARVLARWQECYRRLGMHDPGLSAHQPPGMGLAEVLDRVGELGMCLDLRPDGGPVYLDGTGDGMPLRQVVSADGRANYLACALRELVPLAGAYDDVVLLHDSELEPDYVVLQRLLGRLGVRVHRVRVGRVRVDGRLRSARHGGWAGSSAGALLDAAGAEHPEPVVRLGFRLYFVAVLGPSGHMSFRPDLLHRSLRRAERLLAGEPVDDLPGLDRYLAGLRGDGSHVDPYRLCSRLLDRRPGGPARAVVTELLT